MDIMETNPQVSNDESINQMQYPQNDFKASAVIQDYNGMSTNVYDIPLPPTNDYSHQLIINEDISDHTEFAVATESVNNSNEHMDDDILPSFIGEVDESVSLPPAEPPILESDDVPLSRETLVGEAVQETIEEEVIPETVTSENITNTEIPETDTSELTSENVKDEAISQNETSEAINDNITNEVIPESAVSEASSENVTTETSIQNIETISGNDKSEIISENDTGEVTSENVSSEAVSETVASGAISESVASEATSENVASEGISENVASEVTSENVTGEVVYENVESEVISESGTTNEIDMNDSQETVIVPTNDVNVKYTVLPPGENSVYQEDGTLVVEYPLHEATEEVQTESQNSEDSVQNPTSNFEFVDAEQQVQLKEDKPEPKRKGRKASGCIPLHIIGHNIDKPVQEVPNGKPVLKPRLGVKIPYRNLASQIVSTTELQQHIVERARQKQEANNLQDNSNSFAKKLTHRLAQSLSGIGKVGTSKKEFTLTKANEIRTKSKAVPEVKVSRLNPKEATGQKPVEVVQKNEIQYVEVDLIADDKIGEPSVISSSDSQPDVTTSTEEISDSIERISEEITSITPQPKKRLINIESNSDLIAILEGDGDEGSPILNLPKSVEDADSSDISSEIKAIEKELSEQKNAARPAAVLKEKKFFKSRDSRNSDAGKERVSEVKATSSLSKDAKVSSESKSSKTVSKSEEVKAHSSSKSNDSKAHSSSRSEESKAHSSSRTLDSKSSSSKSPVKSCDLKKTPSKDKEKVSSEDKGKSSGTVVEVEPQLKPTMVLKTYTRKRKSMDISTPEPPKKPLIAQTPPPTKPDPKIDFVTPVPPNAYVTKSSRVIKKKVIWDPDEALPSVRNQSKILSKIEASPKPTPSPKATPSPKSTTPAKIIERKLSEKEKQSETPKSVKPIEKKAVKSVAEETETKTVPPEKQVMKKPDKTEVPKKVNKSPAATKSPLMVKNPAASAAGGKVSPGKSPRKFKKLSEIDRLLMDEGAVNMLYDINNLDDQKRRVSSRGAASSADKAQIQKELMDRTLEVKNELTQQGNTSSSETVAPKSLRKKEGPSPAKEKEKEFKEMTGPAVMRKMSKDSSKSSIHSPPPSPAAFSQAEASRIIRRHSSSSFSSNDELVQETLAELEEKEKERQSKKRPLNLPQPSTSTPNEEEIATPEMPAKERVAKKKAGGSIIDVTPRKKMKKEKQPQPVDEDGKPIKPVEITMKCDTGDFKTDPTKAFTLIKMNRHYMINLTYSGNENYLTVQLLKDLTVVLRELSINKNCTVVSLHSQGPAFCLGLDYKGLVESNHELRVKRAREMSNCIREFLKCLLTFPKVIVAGIKGDCVGFGVTMLPLFDMIVASDSASFCTPYAKLGCAPEAGFLLSIPFQPNHGLASELLYTTQRMNADEAQRRGLITKLFWPEKFDTEFRALLSHIGNLSKSSLMATKSILRMSHAQATEQTLNTSCKMLAELWTGEECQRNFTNYNALTFEIDQ